MRPSRLGLGAVLCILALALGGARVADSLDDYTDPWGLPSGSGSLALATQDSIASGADIEGFDFATGTVVDTSGYMGILAAGVVDLLFFELASDPEHLYFRAPEDEDAFDRYLIASLGDTVGIDEIASMAGVELERFVTVEAGFIYVLLQIQADAAVETTAVKLEVTSLSETSVSFNWVWQPNGSLEFIPTAVEETSLSRLKALFAR